MLANYYRTLEEIRDKEFAEAQQARQFESEQLQREHVRREHFEMQHRRREFAIVTLTNIQYGFSHGGMSIQFLMNSYQVEIHRSKPCKFHIGAISSNT